MAELANTKSNDYKQKLKALLDPGILFFLVIIIYVCICVYISFKSKSIVGYQVKTGTLSENRIYTGIALRDEKIVTSPVAGYISLFLREGERTSYNNLVYSIDESGKLSDLSVKDPNVDNSLSSAELNDLKQDIMLFSKNFDNSVFAEATAFESKINEDVIKIQNRQVLEDVERINSMHLNDIINFYNAKRPGIVTFYEDGFEQTKSAELTKKSFDMETYEKHEVFNDDCLSIDDFVYKYTQDENWSICILVSNDELIRLYDTDFVEVKFSKTGETSWAGVSVVNNFDDSAIVELSFTNSMVTFCKDRFVEIELLIEGNNGLKVPNSSITDNNFFLIDKAFVDKKENGTYGVNKIVANEKGEIFTKYVELNVYKETDTEYYVEMLNLAIGDTLVSSDNEKPTYDEEETHNKARSSEFTVGKQGTLIGVYNINKGYADFKKVDVLYSNDEYSIIKPYDANGIKAYDFIALDATAINNKDFIY